MNKDAEALWLALGITETYCRSLPLPMYDEEAALVPAGTDIYGRTIKMTQDTLDQWHLMFDAAKNEGVELQIVSAFRSLQYQHDLIKRKLDTGRALEDILLFNTPPGFSEHHTGRALDLTTPHTPPLELVFIC